MRRRLTAVAATLLCVTMAAPAVADGTAYPDVIPLPDGFFPEGIATGVGPEAYVGSLAGGAIWKGDLRTGVGDVLVEGAPGGIAVGLDFDTRSGALFVAGGPGGDGRVYDGDTGDLLASFDLGDGFVNDVIVTRTTAWFTNSFVPELYAVPLDAQGQVTGPATTVPLTGDFDFTAGQFNANGIVAVQDGRTLIVANSFAGTLYAVDAATGVATAIDLGGVDVSGDGLVLVGHRLYVNENAENRIAEIELSPDFTRGILLGYLTSDDYDVPTTSAVFGASLYAVNAKFGTPPLPSTPYEIVRVDR